MTVAWPESSFSQFDAEVRWSVRNCSSLELAGEPRALQSDEIHIWHAEISATTADELTSLNLLSEDEIIRMRRFHFDKDRQNFIFCRSMLRILLASYMGKPPAELCFAYSALGKPSLAISSVSLEFNLSHSNGGFLIAVALDRKVGVDIEFQKPDVNLLEVAQRFFSASEKRAIEDLPHELRSNAFFSCWTRKEAFVKALGKGLSRPLDSFDVSVMPNEQSVSLTTRPDGSDATGWMLRSLNCFPGYKAAVAVQSKPGPKPF